ncbi:MAG: MarR family transcriptional regulator [Lachnospiraceae bacterium]|nr:MarR family transcriptional regulator [Lachnospiraceae bacterium]
MDNKGGFYITQIKQLQDRIFEKLLFENGIPISGAQERILSVLWQKDHMTIGEISKATSLAKNTVSIVVNGMVTKGILQRNCNPNNRRQAIVSLTDYARSIQQECKIASQQMNEIFYAKFTKEEQLLFENYLTRILDTLIKAEHTNN